MSIGTMCSVAGCKSPVHAKGLCAAHYQQRLIAAAPPCSVDDCDRGQFAKGLCPRHYNLARDASADGPRCSEKGCDRRAVARGMCRTCYMRNRPNAGYTDRADRVEIVCVGVDNPYFKNGRHAEGCKRKWTTTRARAQLSESYKRGEPICHPCFLWGQKLGQVEAARRQLRAAEQPADCANLGLIGPPVRKPENRREVHQLIARAHRLLLPNWPPRQKTVRRRRAGRQATTNDWNRQERTTAVAPCRCGAMVLLDVRKKTLIAPCGGFATSPAPEVAKRYFSWAVIQVLTGKETRSIATSQGYSVETVKDGIAWAKSHLPPEDHLDERYRNLIRTIRELTDPGLRRSNRQGRPRATRPRAAYRADLSASL